MPVLDCFQGLLTVFGVMHPGASARAHTAFMGVDQIAAVLDDRPRQQDQESDDLWNEASVEPPSEHAAVGSVLRTSCAHQDQLRVVRASRR